MENDRQPGPLCAAEAGTAPAAAPPASAAPAVTVVVPVFNAERTLAATLETVVAQTFRDFEIVVVDDGSTDGSQAIAGRFAARDARLRVLHKPWSGVADTRNAGIDAARAPLVAAIDADDVWHPSFLAKMHAALTAADQATFAYANFRRIDLDGMVLGSSPNYDVSGWAFHRFLIKNLVGNGSGILFRRDAALAVGAYERRLQHEFDAPGCEDWLLQMRLARRGPVVAVPEYLVGYRRVPGAMSEDRVRLNRSRMHAFRILFGEVDCRESVAARWALGRSQAEYLFHALLAGHLREGLPLLPEALALDPLGTLDAFVRGLGETLLAGLRGVLPRRQRPLRPFADHDPAQDRRNARADLIARRLADVAPLDLWPGPTGSAA